MIIYTACLSLGLMACSNGKTEQSNEGGNASRVEVKQESSGVIEAYILLKDALVQTDAPKAKTDAESMSNALGEGKLDAKLIEAARSISSSEDIEQQRAQFKIITDGLIASLKANGTEDGVFVQYCPMAFNSAGANWLSLTEDIKNPYFGDKMLKCGSVKEKL